MKILVVEDNLLTQKMIGFILSNWGFEFDLCNNGLHALKLLDRESYQLILLDLQMPEMNGYETITEIRMQLKLKLPVILMSAEQVTWGKKSYVDYGFNDFIPKPIKESSLNYLINKYIHHQLIQF